MPSPTDPKREAILAAAQIQFSRYGFRRTSMADIASETGVSRASLYSHFESKEEIFRMLSEAITASASAGEIDLQGAGLTAPPAAEILQLSAAGLKQNAADRATVEKRVRRFVRVFVSGLKA